MRERTHKRDPHKRDPHKRDPHKRDPNNACVHAHVDVYKCMQTYAT